MEAKILRRRNLRHYKYKSKIFGKNVKQGYKIRANKSELLKKDRKYLIKQTENKQRSKTTIYF